MLRGPFLCAMERWVLCDKPQRYPSCAVSDTASSMRSVGGSCVGGRGTRFCRSGSGRSCCRRGRRVCPTIDIILSVFLLFNFLMPASNVPWLLYPPSQRCVPRPTSQNSHGHGLQTYLARVDLLTTEGVIVGTHDGDLSCDT